MKPTVKKKKKEKLKFNRFIEKTMKISNKGHKNNENNQQWQKKDAIEN